MTGMTFSDEQAIKGTLVDNNYDWDDNKVLTIMTIMFLLTYYGLFRVGELTRGTHIIHAANVHIGSPLQPISTLDPRIIPSERLKQKLCLKF